MNRRTFIKSIVSGISALVVGEGLVATGSAPSVCSGSTRDLTDNLCTVSIFNDDNTVYYCGYIDSNGVYYVKELWIDDKVTVYEHPVKMENIEI